MAKIYTEKPLPLSKMTPKKETIQFLLDYSKALCMLKTRTLRFECIAN